MAFCTNCGNSVPEEYAFCTNCGTKVQATPVAVQQPNNDDYNGGYDAPAGSTWDGGVLETFLASIVYSLIVTFTCGIATPWAVCYFYKFVISHVIIDGKRLYFNGTGGSLFGNWLLWTLLTVITCGIYGFWVAPKMYKWFSSHTHFYN